MKSLGVYFFVLLFQSLAFEGEDEHHHHHHHVVVGTVTRDAASKDAATKGAAIKDAATKESQLVAKMKALEAHLAKKSKTQALDQQTGHLLVNGPLPADFSERFSQAVAQATGADARSIKLTARNTFEDDVVSVDFKASPKVVSSVESQAADPESKLASGSLHSFLVAKSDEAAEPTSSAKAAATPAKGLDIDTAMPYGDLEAFGREDTAQELTEHSVTESNSMVDQLERAEVAEEKRSVFRALTRLRGAAITSFDGVARSQTGNIEDYNKVHKWRGAHPLHHLADEESDVSKWAFPNSAEF